MTNRQAHEQAAGMSLEDSFFRMNGIDPDAEFLEIADEELREIEREANDPNVEVPEMRDIFRGNKNTFYQIKSKSRAGYLAYENDSPDKPMVAFDAIELANIFCNFYNTFFGTDFIPVHTLERIGEKPDTEFNKNLNFIFVDMFKIGEIPSGK